MKNQLLPLVLVSLAVALSGCGESGTKFDGVGFTLVNDHSMPFYFKVWSNEYPEPNPGQKGKLINGTNTVYQCADGEANYRQKGNYLDTIYVKVAIYELKETPNGPEPGQELESKRWDGLECFKAYTVVLDEQRELQLYKCQSCWTPEEREGLKPWAPSPA